MKYGICFENLESFYKKFCLLYPNMNSDLQRNFENFRVYVKEFVTVLGNQDITLLENNIIFCGLDAGKVHTRIMGLTYISK